MVKILITIEEGENGVGLNSAVLSKPSEETAMEIEMAKMYSVAAKAVEMAIQKVIAESATMIEGKAIEDLATKLMIKEGFTPMIKAIKDSGFELPE